jgi:hypothetical protein
VDDEQDDEISEGHLWRTSLEIFSRRHTVSCAVVTDVMEVTISLATKPMMDFNHQRGDMLYRHALETCSRGEVRFHNFLELLCLR